MNKPCSCSQVHTEIWNRQHLPEKQELQTNEVLIWLDMGKCVVLQDIFVNIMSFPLPVLINCGHHSVRTCWAGKNSRSFLANYTNLRYLLDQCCFQSNNTDTVIEMLRYLYVQSSVTLLIIDMTIVDFWWTN